MCISALFKYFIVLIALVFSTFYLLPSTFAVHAQQPQTVPYLQPNTNPDVPNNLNTWTQNVVINIIAALTCQLIGVDPVNPDQKCLGVDRQTGKIGFVGPSTGSGQGGGGGAIGVAGHLIAATFTPPASTAQYLSYMGDKFGIVEKAYAQGTGFTGISPLVKIWELFRNVTYLAFVIVFVVIGFAIMLRVRIDPRTVMTIQNSIPRIIIALVLVTFSFAIAGFLIDLMYVVSFLFINILAQAGVSIDLSLARDIQGSNVFEFVNSNVSVGEGGVLSIVGAAAGAISSFVTSFAQDTANRISGLLGNILGGVVGALAAVIIAIAILWALFRLWFALIMAFVWILIDIIFAPLWVLAGLLPGSPIGFTAWLRDIVAHLSAFPTTIFMLLLGKVFIEAFTKEAESGGVFIPPLIGAPSAEALGALIALGIILLTPQVVNMVKDAFKAPKFPYGAAIGQAVGAGAAVPGTPVRMVTTSAEWFAGQKMLQRIPFFRGLIPQPHQ